MSNNKYRFTNFARNANANDETVVCLLITVALLLSMDDASAWHSGVTISAAYAEWWHIPHGGAETR